MNMLGVFQGVKPIVKQKPKAKPPRADNVIFKLHYKFTFALLLACCVMISSYAFIDKNGSAIQCMVDSRTLIPTPIINRYCWITSTFTLPKHFEGVKGEDFIHYGVGPYNEGDEKIYHAYYQWVPLVLFLQAMMFYFPHWLWKTIEGQRFSMITLGLHNYLFGEDEKKDKTKILAGYMKQRMTMTNDHRSWAVKLISCEILNFVNVVGQIFFTDHFLGNEFKSYGIEVLKFSSMDPENRVDPMSRVFPRMTKCIFHKYGGSGTIQRFDALCVLGMNILSEKIYIFLWFWFVILAILTGMNLVFRIVQYFYKGHRMQKISKAYNSLEPQFKEPVRTAVMSLSYADWLIVYYLSSALERHNFQQFLKTLAAMLNAPVNPMRSENHPLISKVETLKSKVVL